MKKPGKRRNAKKHPPAQRHVRAASLVTMGPRAAPNPGALRAALQRARRRRRQRGIALIMVLGAITILTVFLTELQTDTTSAVAGALAERDRLKAEYYARSGINLSRLLLAAERPLRVKAGAGIIGIMLQQFLGTRRAPQMPVWEFSDMMLGAFNGGDRAHVFGSNVGVDLSTAKNIGIPGNGYFELTIVDEDSKININTAASSAGVTPTQVVQQLMTMFAQPQYQAMFEQPDGDGQQSDAFTLCSSLLDWGDPDEVLTNCADPSASAGSEDNIYQMLGLGYIRKNAPYDSLEEVRLVRGMDDDRWATFIDPEPNDPRKRLLTIWGQGTGSNVNTAPPAVLWTLVCSVAVPGTPLCTDPLQAAAFLQAFTLVRTFGRGAPLFPSYAAFKAALEGKGLLSQMLLAPLGVTPVTFDKTLASRSKLRKLFKSESKVFSIYAEGVVPGQAREARVRIHAVVDMRQAAQWSQQAQTNPDDPTGKTTAATPGNNNVPVDDENSPVDQDFMNDLATNPFGSIVYYRVE